MKTEHKLLIAGHGGAHGLAIDNTLAGYKTALKHNVDLIETDSRLTADGIVVQFHDRTTLVSGKSRVAVSDLSFQKLKKLHPDLTTLEQTIEFVDRQACLMLEIKDPAAAVPVARIIEKFLAQGWRSDNFMLASFNYRTLRRLKNLLPQVRLVVLDSKLPLRAILRAALLDTNYLSISQSKLWWGAVWLLSRRHNLFCYPSRKALRLNHMRPLAWQKFGLHGTITDFPNYYKK